MQQSLVTNPFGSEPGQFSAPRSLPTPLTPLLGREEEQAHLLALLQKPEVRLLTLTGPGGVGKTRLLIAVAQVLPSSFVDHICFVSLGAISDPAFVIPAIAQALGLWEAGSRSPLEDLKAAIADQSYLLLLDNFEHVLAAAPDLTSLLIACPRLRLLVSSRAPVRLSGEYEFALAPLPLPEPAQDISPITLVQSAACALFVQHAQAIQPQFEVTKKNAPAVAEICIRLDGLPLAIELAASRIRLLSPQALLTRLSRRLSVLIDGSRDAPARQRTLRATLAWSYQLLASLEQQLFRWIAVFNGGCQLAALEAITGHAGLEESSVLQGVSVLLENHLVRQVEQMDGEPRLLLLETIREYGLECLDQCEEREQSRVAHAAYYLAYAEGAAREGQEALRPSNFHAVMPHLARKVAQEGRIVGRQVEPLEREQENLRAALNFLLERARLREGTPEGILAGEQALRMCVALSWFWHVRGYGREGLAFLMQALSVRVGAGSSLRARALYEAAELAFIYARTLPLDQLAQESVALYRELDDPVGLAYSLSRLGGISRVRSQFAQAQEQLEEAATRFQLLGNRWRQGQCWTEQARAAMEQGHYEKAEKLLTQSLELYQELGDQQRLGWVCFLRARLLFVWRRDLEQAQNYAEQSLIHFQQQGDTPYCVYPLGLLGLLSLERGNQAQARSLLQESLTLGKRTQVETDAVEFTIGLARLMAEQGEVDAARNLYEKVLTLLSECQVYYESIAASLEGLAALETEWGDPEEAARLWGAGQAVREVIGAPMSPAWRASSERAQAQVRARLNASAWSQALEEGCELALVQALVAQRKAMPSSSRPTVSAPAPVRQTFSAPAGLTAREHEVLRWLAEGWTDAQIAEQLVISPRTVNRHTTSLYSKLGVSSRSAATRWALEHQVV